ncbi:hypothetical protein [Mucilaginibacter aquariorum]|uniref:Uncharacterized protein n=1 Tax=Mucilaginibacter aquariorum TaxID=2967225 RepID=A0ABT1T0S6_9SPHI|nr:hypothetical protein [Mucilaginibacter aquariorum]MCQ6958195.1 hypothetical protein [Mucilaginibacter aquariorum]
MCRFQMCKYANEDDGVAYGPGFALIRAQALGARPVSAPIPNAEVLFCHAER